LQDMWPISIYVLNLVTTRYGVIMKMTGFKILEILLADGSRESQCITMPNFTKINQSNILYFKYCTKAKQIICTMFSWHTLS